MTANLNSQEQIPADGFSGCEGEAANPLFGLHPPAMLVGLMTTAAFLPVLRNGFVSWDEALIVQNKNIRGWGMSEWVWMLTDVKAAGYRPLTWLTFKWDYLV